MKSFADLSEARKNPEDNKRIPAFKYLNDHGYLGDDYFITFTDLLKVGINPQSTHNTPNGIYCFPSKILNTLGGAMYNVPYAKTAKYIHVLKLKSRSGIIDPLESYSIGDFKRDMVKLKKFYQKAIPELRDDEFDYFVSMGRAESTHNMPFGWLWNVTRILSSEESLNIGLGWGGVKGGEYKKRYASDKSEEGIMEYKKGVQASAQGWNNLLRAMGYSGFIDSGSSGIIHANEPMQAVFLEPSAYTVVDMVLNKEYERTDKYERVRKIIGQIAKNNRIEVTKEFENDTFVHDIFILNMENAELDGCDIKCDDNSIVISRGNVNGGNFFGSVIYFSSCNLFGGSFERVSIYDCYKMGDIQLKNNDVQGGTV